MTHRQRMLAALRGEPCDRIPWAPRMDLWTIALRARGAVPNRFAGMNTAEIADELGVACHAVRADYTLAREAHDHALRGLGFDNHPDYPYRIELRKLPIEFHHQDGRFETTIRTGVGDVTTSLQLTPAMLSEGISIPFVEKYPICSHRDFEPVARVFEHLEVIPSPQSYDTFHSRIGDRGLAVATGPLGCSPMHLLLHDLMAMEEFYVSYAEDRPALEQLARRLDPFYDALLEASLSCDAEVIFWGANYDRDTTWPPFFEEEIVPWLTRISERTHASGKLLLTHTDGENRDLLPYYPRCGFDCGESVCTQPMTSCTLADVRRGMGPDATVWGGIPCVVLLDDVMDEDGFESYVDRLFAELDGGGRLIFGVSDNVPPDVNLTRLERIKEWIEAFGAVHPPS